jgi:hypothetical protein
MFGEVEREDPNAMFTARCGSDEILRAAPDDNSGETSLELRNLVVRIPR